MAILGFQSQDVRLTFNLFKMKLRDRYLGSKLGLFWAILQPMFLLGMYTFVFGFIYKSRLPGAESNLAFAIWLISGLVPYLAISEGLMATATSVTGGTGLVKNIVFKSETLPIASTLSAGVPFSVGMLFLFVLLLVDGNYPTWHVVALLPTIALQFAFLAAVGLFLAATTVFLRDIPQVLPTIVLLIVFFTPILYPLEKLPGIIQRVTFFNPFYQMTHPYRDILIDHRLPEPWGFLYLAILTVLLFCAGLKYFRRLKGYFGSAL